jgi:Calcium-binding EGF domain
MKDIPTKRTGGGTIPVVFRYLTSCCGLLSILLWMNMWPCSFAVLVVPGRTPQQRAELANKFATTLNNWNNYNPNNNGELYALVYKKGFEKVRAKYGVDFKCFLAEMADWGWQHIKMYPIRCDTAINKQKLWLTYKNGNGDRNCRMARLRDQNKDFPFKPDNYYDRSHWMVDDLRDETDMLQQAFMVQTCNMFYDWYCPTKDFVESTGVDVLACNSGYDIGWYGCEDIDECQEINECPGNSRCVNTEGDYRCDCLDGTSLFYGY